ncbi:hypothetical protein B0H11DRAFT_2088734 [Mycena galericulata]|nr:hypothetical protein B0H11DRAFT_2088734 [Mycena galericulata]
MRHFKYILLALLAPQLALASLWPTHPTANTTFAAGNSMWITWIDTLDRPRLPEMGLINMDLCTADGKYVATFGERISPMQRVHKAAIPHNLTSDGPYVIIFHSTYPRVEYWTADFHITPAITDTALPYTPPQLADVNATHPQLTLVLPDTTVVSTLAPTAEFAAATTISAGPLPSYGVGGTGLNHVHSPNSGNPRKGSHFQDVGFRLTFILWPALIGISMAL